jgi:hypothetical protein
LTRLKSAAAVGFKFDGNGIRIVGKAALDQLEAAETAHALAQLCDARKSD